MLPCGNFSNVIIVHIIFSFPPFTDLCDLIAEPTFPLNIL